MIKSIEKKKKLYGLLFVSPFIIGTIVFFVGPLVQSLIFSFNKITNIVNLGEMQFIGFGNYLEAFTIDISFIPIFIQVVRDTLIGTPITVVFSLIIAVMLNKKIRFRGFFRTVYFLPFLLGSGMILSLLLQMGVDEKSMDVMRGVLLPDEIRNILGPSVTLFLSEFLNRITFILWRSGVQILLFLSGLQGISTSLYESARCDGATEWEMFWLITIPMISPVILLNLVYTIIDYFGDVTNVMVQYFVKNAFQLQRFDYASALSWIYFLFVFVLILLVFLFMRRYIFYASEKESYNKI